jgi:transcriptional regulator with XRE-family HTH domain
MSKRPPVEKAAARRTPVKPASFGNASLSAAPDRLLARIDAGRGTSLGAALRAGALVRGMRKAIGYSQKDLAARLDISQARVSEIEAGVGPQGPTWALMERIAAACGRELGLLPIGDQGEDLYGLPIAAEDDSHGIDLLAPGDDAAGMLVRETNRFRMRGEGVEIHLGRARRGVPIDGLDFDVSHGEMGSVLPDRSDG